MKPGRVNLTLNQETVRRLTAAESADVLGGNQQRDSGAAVCPLPQCPTDSMTTRWLPQR